VDHFPRLDSRKESLLNIPAEEIVGLSIMGSPFFSKQA